MKYSGYIDPSTEINEMVSHLDVFSIFINMIKYNNFGFSCTARKYSVPKFHLFIHDDSIPSFEDRDK